MYVGQAVPDKVMQESHDASCTLLFLDRETDHV